MLHLAQLGPQGNLPDSCTTLLVGNLYSIRIQSRVPGLYPSGHTPKKFPQHGPDVAFIRTNPLALGYNPRGTTLKP